MERPVINTDQATPVDAKSLPEFFDDWTEEDALEAIQLLGLVDQANFGVRVHERVGS